MNTTPTEIESVLNSLAATPRLIATASEGLSPAQLRFKPDDDTWSMNEVLAHLRACADVWGKSIMAMIVQDHPTLRYISPRSWIKRTDYLSLHFRLSFEAFSTQRQALLQSLKALEPIDWSRGATFTATTKGREQTVLSYAQRISRHEVEHCEQISTLVKQAKH
jgi:uncharacterized damage-inducible protein DinB